MQLRMSECGVLYRRANQWVWDDYLGHAQHALAAGTERVLRWFTQWRELESVRRLAVDEEGAGGGDRDISIARALLGANILVELDSSRHRQEESVRAAWEPWGALVRAYHYSTHIGGDTQFLPTEIFSRTLLENVATCPPPPACKRYPGAPRLPLPRCDAADWVARDLVDVLYRRRSHRDFNESSVPLTALGALLEIAGGAVEFVPEHQTVFKTTPSGGGRHPTEIYLYVRNVSQVSAGVYHYDPFDHVIERIGASRSDAELVAACGSQEWTRSAGVYVFYTSVISRSQWKYYVARAYRVLHYDVGHLSQTVYLLATALGLRMTFTGAVRDQLIEELVGCDPADELVMGCTVIGT